MPSPFPGMDPYLEDPALWSDVHFRLIAATDRHLRPYLPPNYYSSLAERLYVEDVRSAISPDVTVLRVPRSEPLRGGTATLVADEPTVLLFNLEVREPYLEIRSVGSHEVVTVIELISPTNKSSAGRGRDEYRTKQDQVLASRANLVEIDLLRRARTVAYVPPGSQPSLPPYDYLISINRACARDRSEVYAFTLRDRLPRIRIPLREPDPDVVLDLPAAFNECYVEGAYPVRIDYRKAPREPLRPEDESWVDDLLRSAGLRG